MDNTRYGLGRKHAYDRRDQQYPLQAVVRPTEGRRWRYWYQGGWWGNQGTLPHCVAFAWAHLVEDAPVLYPEEGSVVNTTWLYDEAQMVDEWPGEAYDGTSVRAGAKVLQAAGYITEYRWAFDVDTIIDCLLNTGPVVLGTHWWSSMFYAPDAKEPIEVAGQIEGGHAYKADGVNLDHGVVRCKNSWGRDWGHKGRFFLTFEDLARLISEDGEACMPVEAIH